MNDITEQIKELDFYKQLSNDKSFEKMYVLKSKYGFVLGRKARFHPSSRSVVILQVQRTIHHDMDVLYSSYELAKIEIDLLSKYSTFEVYPILSLNTFEDLEIKIIPIAMVPLYE